MTPQHPNMKLLLVAGKVHSEGSDGEKGYSVRLVVEKKEIFGIGASIVNLQVGALVLTQGHIIVFVSGFACSVVSKHAEK